MTALLRAELRKFRYTRSLWLLLTIGVGVNLVAATVLVVAFKAAEFAPVLSEHGPLRFGPTNIGLLIALVSIRVFGDESHHGTLAATLVREPSRRRVFAAKAVIAVGLALAVCAVMYAVIVPVTLGVLGARNVPMEFDAGTTALLFLRTCAAMALTAAIAVALAAAARNRTAVLVGYLVWIALAEGLVGWALRIADYMPGRLVQSLVTNSGDVTAAAALFLLVAVAAVATAGALVGLARDVD